jgi:hypothetical protein
MGGIGGSGAGQRKSGTSRSRSDPMSGPEGLGEGDVGQAKSPVDARVLQDGITAIDSTLAAVRADNIA